MLWQRSADTASIRQNAKSGRRETEAACILQTTVCNIKLIVVVVVVGFLCVGVVLVLLLLLVLLWWLSLLLYMQ
jgi:Flp pilus assembly protein TadB